MTTELTNSNASGNASNQGGLPPNSDGQTPPTSTTPHWRDSLPADLKDHPSLASFTDIGNLAKSYVNAQSMIGKKGVIPPTDKSSDEEWDNFYKQIGRPEADKYEFDTPKEANADTIKAFKAVAHKAGLLPKQAKALVEWFGGFEKEASGKLSEQKALEQKASLENLKKEWGTGYDKEITAAKLAVKEVGGEEFAQYLEKTGLGNDAGMIKAMAKFGKLLGEDKIRGANTGRMGVTPEEAKAKIAELTSDPAYADSRHGRHQVLVNQVSELYKQLYQQ